MAFVAQAVDAAFEGGSPWNPALPPAFGPASDTQNPTNRRRGKECVAQRVLGRKRIRECVDGRFGTCPVGFRSGFILCPPVQIGPGGMNAPRRRGNLEPLQNREALLDLLLCTFPVLLSHRDSCV